MVNQIHYGNTSLVGVMIESNLIAGNQPIPKNPALLRYGCSGHRRLRRLGKHGKVAARCCCRAAQRAVETNPITHAYRGEPRMRPLIRPFTRCARAPNTLPPSPPRPTTYCPATKPRVRAAGKPYSSCTFPRPRSTCRRKSIYYAPECSPPAENLKKLIDDGILVREATPCYYAYRLVKWVRTRRPG